MASFVFDISTRNRFQKRTTLPPMLQCDLALRDDRRILLQLFTGFQDFSFRRFASLERLAFALVAATHRCTKDNSQTATSWRSLASPFISKMASSEKQCLLPSRVITLPYGAADRSTVRARLSSRRGMQAIVVASGALRCFDHLAIIYFPSFLT
jgi:hypothetical protein